MEVGSGCGIIGLVAAHFADSVLLTDGDEAELPLIQRNAELYSPSTCKVEAEFLEWGPGKSNGRLFDVILGQEVVYMPDCIPLLAAAIKLHLRPDGIAYIGNLRYSTSSSHEEVKGLFLESLTKEGLDFEEIPMTFAPRQYDPRTYVVRIQHKAG